MAGADAIRTWSGDEADLGLAERLDRIESLLAERETERATLARFWESMEAVLRHMHEGLDRMEAAGAESGGLLARLASLESRLSETERSLASVTGARETSDATVEALANGIAGDAAQDAVHTALAALEERASATEALVQAMADAINALRSETGALTEHATAASRALRHGLAEMLARSERVASKAQK